MPWMGCWFYMGCWVRITNRRNWLSTVDMKLSGGTTFIFKKYMPRTRFKSILGSLHYRVQKDVGYCDGYFHMRKMEEAWNLNMDEEFNP